jgi:hypothetical protein
MLIATTGGSPSRPCPNYHAGTVLVASTADTASDSSPRSVKLGIGATCNRAENDGPDPGEFHMLV